MAIKVPRGRSDEIINKIIEALRRYEVDHPQSQIDLYRQNPVSVRLRIVDPDFAGLLKHERHDIAWQYLDQAADEAQSDISMLVLLTPDEVETSVGNSVFEDPVPSLLDPGVTA